MLTATWLNLSREDLNYEDMAYVNVEKKWIDTAEETS